MIGISICIAYLRCLIYLLLNDIYTTLKVHNVLAADVRVTIQLPNPKLAILLRTYFMDAPLHDLDLE